MLLNFNFSNHLSFRDAAEFSTLRIRPTESTHAESWNPQVSSVAAIYGPNASGKSNLIDALRNVQRLVTSTLGTSSLDEVSLRHPFTLNADSRKDPSAYGIQFMAQFEGEIREFIYQIEVQDDYISSEALHVYRSIQPTRLFLRKQDSADSAPETSFNRSFSATEQSIIRRVLKPWVTVLSASKLLDKSQLEGAFSWFSEHLTVYNARGFEAEHERVKQRLREKNSAFRSELVRYLQAADLGICSVELTELDDDKLENLRKLLESSEIPEELIESIVADQRSVLSLGHTTEDGTVNLPFNLESDGTKAMMSFASVASIALANGSVLVIDEIDTSLHPMLVQYLVKQFTDPRTNPLQAQLVVTTHDVSLLSTPVLSDQFLDKDQIWFVEKDRAGASSLYALSEFSTRRDDNFLRRYMLGQFGAVPRISDSFVHSEESDSL